MSQTLPSPWPSLGAPPPFGTFDGSNFHIPGNPGGIRARVAIMRSEAAKFTAVGDALAKLSTDGWSGRAADRFREKFATEPGRWHDAGSGFLTAAGALEWYAGQLESAQQVAAAQKAEYARGEQVTQEARAAYDADVARGQSEKAAAEARGQQFTLTILPFSDPGEAIRQSALSTYDAAKSNLEADAHSCAGQVRAGCAGAPDKRNWLESGLAFVGDVLVGIGEGVWDLVSMGPKIALSVLSDVTDLISGDLTTEEFAAKYKMKLEDAQALLEAAKDDPMGFAKNLGKALLDVDTWKDDPGRALGRLIPDAVLAVVTGGAGTAALRGARAARVLGKAGEGLADGLTTAARHLDDLGAGIRSATRLDRLPDEIWALVQKPVGDLTPEERGILQHERDLIKAEPGTLMQRVISAKELKAFESNTPDGLVQPTEAYGFVSRAEDVAHLKTPQNMVDGLGLDYAGSEHLRPGQNLAPNQGGEAVEEMYVVRYALDNENDVMVPRDASLGGYKNWNEAAHDPTNPFTGNGYTKGGIPEFRTTKGNELGAGSEIWRVDAQGNRSLHLVMNAQRKWEKPGG